MKVPADFWVRSPRVYRGLEELTYPFHDHTILVTGCGRICFRSQKVNLSHTAQQLGANASAIARGDVRVVYDIE